jgi:uncharacterized membrane protein HdeD (DUF308 family)
MEKISSKNMTLRRVLGLAVIGLGVIVVFSPVLFGEWVISLLGAVLVAAGLIQFVQTIRTADETSSALSYVTSVLLILLGLILFVSPEVALVAILIVVTSFLLIDGGIKLYGAYLESGSDRWWGLFNGLFSIGLALLVWFFVSVNLGMIAIGIVLGLKLIVQGWTMFFLPEKDPGTEPAEIDPRKHPDERLKLKPSDTVAELQNQVLQGEPTVSGQDIIWCLTILGIFFIIHAVRTNFKWSLIALISPFTAVIGDAVMALILGIVVILPFRLLWRWLTRPGERVAWHRFERLREKSEEATLIERALGLWLFARMRFSIELRHFRYSLNYTFWHILRFGMPIVMIIVAVNFLWGFSWYFNTENWASGVFQAITKTRVDPWRKAMTEATEQAALEKGIPPEKVFAIEPEGVAKTGDFSFIVIGDTGEGDASQVSLRDQLIASDKREDVKFLVVSSDVIYPDGKMTDYEMNFYLPFKGFEKPIYAIPGNHDWFDANNGFNANFLDAESAKLALRARVVEDFKTDAVVPEQQFDEIIAEAARLRNYYGINNGLQRAPYFEMHTPGFSLITVDTGILRSLDEKEKAWLEAALQRAGQNFKMVVLGHPFYVAGKYAAEEAPEFNEIHETLKRHKVEVVMAGDTHDWEFYKTKYSADGVEREMHNFVNGGGGAYLSIGTSLGFPIEPVTSDYGFYPRTDAMDKKIVTQALWWQMPFYYWMKWFNGWPFNQEFVSGAFNFNQAPYFQSFMEVKVERSQNRIRLLLWGVNGQLRWRDIQVNGSTKPPDKSDDDFVEFIIPIVAAQQ